MDQFYIRPLMEADLTCMVEAAGGTVAHLDADRRSRRGSDFILQGAVIELKILSEDGFAKTERQQRLAFLFRDEGFRAPVVVLDRDNLSAPGRRAYDRIIEGPIKTEIASARKQLKETRKERSVTTLSILWVVNNGYTALNHDDLVRLVGHRARNDSQSIDGVIVGGCYFHSDGFDSFFLWPLTYVPIRLAIFSSFDFLHDTWNQFAEQFMSRAIRQELRPDEPKGPVVDTQFEIEGVTYVKPAPQIGPKSNFYTRGRPRTNTSGIDVCPPIALIFPRLIRTEWSKVRHALPNEKELCENYQDWMRLERSGREEGTPLRPFVSVPITFCGWQSWCAKYSQTQTIASVYDYANRVFHDRVEATIVNVREMKESCIVPARYILVVTDEIGRDKANDLSRISVAICQMNGETEFRTIVENLRIFHEYAVALASAYAVDEGLETIFWTVCKKYAWE